MVFLIFVQTVVMVVFDPHLLQFGRTDDLGFQHLPDESVSGLFNLLEVFVLLDLEVKQGHFLSFILGVDPCEVVDPWKFDEGIPEDVLQLLGYSIHDLDDLLPGVFTVEHQHRYSDVRKPVVALYELFVVVGGQYYRGDGLLKRADGLSMRGKNEGKTGEVGELREIADLVHCFLSKNYYALWIKKHYNTGFL